MSWPLIDMEEMIEQGLIKLGRGNVISKLDIAAHPGAYPIYSSAQMNNGKFGEYGKYMFDRELITWSVDGGGQLFYRPKHRFSVTNVAGTLEVLDDSKLDCKYLHYVLSDKHSRLKFDWMRKAHPSVIRRLYTEIPLPPLVDQLRIANLLGKIEALIVHRKQYLKQLDDLLRSVFLQMFGDPARNEKGWDKPELKAFGKISTGNTPPRNDAANYDGNFIEWIKTDNIRGDAVFVTHATECLSEVGVKKSRTVTSGSLLVACIAGSVESIGRAALTNRTVSFNQQINAIQPGKDVNPLFLYGLFKLSRAYIQSHATTGMKKILTKGDFEKITMIKPPIEIQNKFAAILEKVEIIKSRCQQSCADMESLYGSLSKRAFKGELDLSQITLPDTSNQEVKTSVIPTTQSSESKVNEIHLPDTDLMAAALADRTFVKELLQFWLQAYCAQLGGAMFSAQAFLAAAHTHIAELHPDSDFELDANAYEQVKAWAFEALANGRLTQGYADDDNRVTLAMSAKQV